MQSPRWEPVLSSCNYRLMSVVFASSWHANDTLGLPLFRRGVTIATITLSKSARLDSTTVDRVLDLGRLSLTMRTERFWM